MSPKSNTIGNPAEPLSNEYSPATVGAQGASLTANISVNLKMTASTDDWSGSRFPLYDWQYLTITAIRYPCSEYFRLSLPSGAAKSLYWTQSLAASLSALEGDPSRGQVPTWRARVISFHSISLTTLSLQVSFPLST